MNLVAKATTSRTRLRRRQSRKSCHTSEELELYKEVLSERAEGTRQWATTRWEIHHRIGGHVRGKIRCARVQEPVVDGSPLRILSRTLDHGSRRLQRAETEAGTFRWTEFVERCRGGRVHKYLCLIDDS